MTIKWWANLKYTCEVVQIDVDRETEKSFWGTSPWGYHSRSRQAKVTEWGRLCDTWEEAQEACLAHAEAMVARAQQRLEMAEAKLVRVEHERKPKEE